MRVVIQKVTHASVDIEKQTVASINKGLLVLVGIEDSDTDEDIAWLSAKIVNLRVFEDENSDICLPAFQLCPMKRTFFIHCHSINFKSFCQGNTKKALGLAKLFKNLV